ncbi:MAG: hypothetical protein HUU20_26480 [Pirellulales bacterium]|nr:hypothetical protein [Pirellulales bacterium]
MQEYARSPAPQGTAREATSGIGKSVSAPFLIRADDGTVFTASAELIRVGQFDVQTPKDG